MKKNILQYLELYLHINLIIFFAIIKNLFNYLKDIFNNLYEKKHIIK